jgi:hypothetical protein
MVRALPRIAEEGLPERKGLLDRWAHSDIPEKIDASFNSFLLKFLRKFKVMVLKLDNTISNHLRNINHQDKQKKSAIDFKEISGKNESEEIKK